MHFDINNFNKAKLAGVIHLISQVLLFPVFVFWIWFSVQMGRWLLCISVYLDGCHCRQRLWEKSLCSKACEGLSSEQAFILVLMGVTNINPCTMRQILSVFLWETVCFSNVCKTEKYLPSPNVCFYNVLYPKGHPARPPINYLNKSYLVITFGMWIFIWVCRALMGFQNFISH